MLYRWVRPLTTFLMKNSTALRCAGNAVAFQQNGVCLRIRIEDNADPLEWVLTIDRCKQARKSTRGLMRDWGAKAADSKRFERVGLWWLSARIHADGHTTGRRYCTMTHTADRPVASHALF